MRSRLGAMCGVGRGAVRSRGRLTGPATVIYAALGVAAIVAIQAPAAGAAAPPLVQSFSTPGLEFSAQAPPYATAVNITVQGASGAAGSSSFFGTNPGGAGGLGTVITASADVVGGERFDVIVGAAGGVIPRGAAGDGLGGAGGAGGQFSLVAPSGTGVPSFDVIAQGGGGGGGGGGAFFGQAGGNGGEGQFGLSASNGNGANGSGNGAGTGGARAPSGTAASSRPYLRPRHRQQLGATPAAPEAPVRASAPPRGRPAAPAVAVGAAAAPGPGTSPGSGRTFISLSPGRPAMAR